MATYSREFRTNNQLTISAGDVVRDSALIASEENKNVGHGNGQKVGAVENVPAGEKAVFENVYFKGNHGNQGVWIDPYTVEGTVIFRNCTFEYLNDAIYGEIAKQGAGEGKVIVKDCYLKNNNIAHIRLTHDSVVDGCVIHNPGRVPENEKGQRNSRGLHTFYPDSGTVEVRNTHVDIPASTGSAVAIKPHGPHWDIADSQIVGPLVDNGNATYTNVGGNPDTTPPPGVPLSPDAAKSGNSGGGSPVATDGGQNEASNTIPEGAQSVVFAGDGSYEFSTTGSVYKGDSADPEDAVAAPGMAAGVTAGGTDKWYYTGRVQNVTTRNNASYQGPSASSPQPHTPDTPAEAANNSSSNLPVIPMNWLDEVQWGFGNVFGGGDWGVLTWLVVIGVVGLGAVIGVALATDALGWAGAKYIDFGSPK